LLNTPEAGTFPNPAEIRLQQKKPPEPDSFAGFEKSIFPRYFLIT